jgi:1-acyl-sn-glycerol-3-phosphate acyltransferase
LKGEVFVIDYHRFCGQVMESTEMPPVSNRLLYAYRVFAKWFSFFIFGLGTLILVILVFPVMRLFLHPRDKFKKYGRRFVSRSMRFFVFLMHLMGIVNLEAGSREVFRNLSSKIVVANHPSLLDVVMLFSLIPNADCIVNSSLSYNIVRGIILKLYILNSLDFENLSRSCSESLRQGNCIIIFPEGTRTPRTGKIIVKKGAARLSLACGCGIIPVHIGGTDKYGLGKHDPWTAFNSRDKYVYSVSMGNEISPEKYRRLSMPAAVRALTTEVKTVLFPGI